MICFGMCLCVPKIQAWAEAAEENAAEIETEEEIYQAETESEETPEEDVIEELEEDPSEDFTECDIENFTTEDVSVTDGLEDTQEDVTIVATGKSGYANWTLDSEGVLTFSADKLSGPMKDYNYQTTLPDYDAYVEQVKKIIIEDGVTTVGNYAFYRCVNATEISLGNTVEKIGKSALNGQYTEIYIPASVESIAQDGLRRYFGTLTNLKSYNVSPENQYFSSDDRGVLFNKDKTTLMCVPACLEGSYCVPETVSEIKDAAFDSCWKLIELEIGDTIKKIPESLGSSLEKIIIGKSFELTDKNPFTNVAALKNIIVSTENEDYLSVDGDLYNKPGTQLIAYPRAKTGECKIPDGVTEIRTDALTGCAFDKLILSENVTGSLVCQQCNNLKEIVFSDQITSLDCSGSTGLESIKIPDSVTAIFFEGCTGLKQVTLPSKLTSISGSTFRNCKSLLKISLPEGVTTIGMLAFENCNALTEADFPESLNKIDSYAFENCSSLSEIVFPAEIYHIERNSFGYCGNLKKITFTGKTPGNIREDAFTGVTADCYYPSNHLTWNESTKLNYGGTLNWIEYEVDEFENAENKYQIPDMNISLTYAIDTTTSEVKITNCNTDAEGCLEIPSTIDEKTVTGIEAAAFQDCTGLTSVVIPDSVTSIGSSAFQGCTNLTAAQFPEKITTINENTFLNTGLTSFTISENVTTIGDCAFKNTKIAEITIPGNVSVMGTEILANNWKLTKVILADGIEDIPEKMCYECYKLLDVVFPSTLKTIGTAAFCSCVGLNSVVLPEGLTSIGASAFVACGSYDLYHWDMDSDNFTSVVFPSTLTEIGEDAFGLCQSLQSVTIPKSVTRIEYSTFRSCYRLQSVILPATCEYIGEDAFLQCKRLEAVTFEWAAPQIDAEAFMSTTTTCYYPSNNEAWTADMLQNYSGTLTWVAKEMVNPGNAGINISVDNKTSEFENGTDSGTGSGASITPPKDGWKEGSNTFNIECTKPCVALISTDGGKTYKKLEAVKNESGGYDCTADDMTDNTILSVLLLGDINGDGNVSNADITVGKSVVKGISSLDTVRKYAGDLDGNGELSNKDVTMLKAAILGKNELSW